MSDCLPTDVIRIEIACVCELVIPALVTGFIGEQKFLLEGLTLRY